MRGHHDRTLGIAAGPDAGHAAERGRRSDLCVAISNDGTKIAGRVEGQGPPIVLVHGGLGDGEVSWRFMLPFLVDHFTCYLMSTRGRGLSDGHQDNSRQRHFEDVVSFVESIGEPAGVFGHSSGASFVLGAAALAAAHIRGIALYEPPCTPGMALEVSDEAYGRVTAAIAEERTADAVRLAVSEILRLNDDEQYFFSLPEPLEIAERYIRASVRDLPELNRPLDDGTVEKLTMPVLLIQGAPSGVHFKDGMRHLNQRLTHARLVEIAGAGHMAPITAPEAVARELVEFLAGQA